MLTHQEGKCAICRCPETQTRGGKVKNLAVDHCHVTGKVRALLCGRCNLLLGNFRENLLLVESFEEYISWHHLRLRNGSTQYFAGVPLLYDPESLT